MNRAAGNHTALPGSSETILAPQSDAMASDVASTWAAYTLPLVRRWKLFAIVFVLTYLSVVLFTLTQHKSYTTTIKLMAGNPSQGSVAPAGETLPVLNAILGMTGQQSAETYADLLQEPPLARAVIDELHLNIDSSKLLQRLAVKPVTNTAIVSLSVTWSDPVLAARLANTFGDVFVKQQRELVQGQADVALAFLNREMPLAERRMRSAQRAEVDYQSSAGIANVDTQTQALLQNIATIDTKIGEQKVSIQQVKGALDELNRSLPGIDITASGEQNTIPNALRAQLLAQQSQLELQLRTAEGTYTSNHPTVVALRLQLATLKGQIQRQPDRVVASTITAPNPIYRQLAGQRASLLTQQESEEAQLHELRRQQKALRPLLRKLPETAAHIVELKRQTQEAAAVYSQLRAKYNEASLERTTVPSAVAIVVRASPDSASVAPSLRVNMLVGLLLALGFATTAVFLAHLLDRTLKDERDIETELALPVLTRVPALEASRGRDLATTNAMSAEAFQQLIWSLRYSSDERFRSISVTSASPGDGKSTIALNTAVAFAEVFATVLLIDADLRRPSQHIRLGLPRALGLSDVLAGAATLDQVVKSTSRPGLFFLSAGTQVPNPVKLLQSERLSRLLEEASHHYTMIIVDTPALNVVFDAAVLCAKTDASVMVVSSSTTDITQAKRAIRKLSDAKVDSLLGVVLNRAKQRTGESSYYGSIEDAMQLVLPSEGDDPQQTKA